MCYDKKITDPLTFQLSEQLTRRVLPLGGFSAISDGYYRTDATCWAVIALAEENKYRFQISCARNRLSIEQSPNGAITMSPEHPEAIWPTALAILAWHRSPEYRENQIQAVNFLIASSGRYWQRTEDSPFVHDTSIKGWPWISDTHAWVEPTAMAMIALKLVGYGEHERVKEAARLLLDRQLPQGGWNYGNSSVFGQTLNPMPLSTGMALNALIDITPMVTVERSLTYLRNRVHDLRTPRSLAWSLLGLGAWNSRPEYSLPPIDACLKNQDRYGGYDTESLSLLMIAHQSSAGLEGIYANAVKS